MSISDIYGKSRNVLLPKSSTCCKQSWNFVSNGLIWLGVASYEDRREPYRSGPFLDSPWPQKGWEQYENGFQKRKRFPWLFQLSMLQPEGFWFQHEREWINSVAVVVGCARFRMEIWESGNPAIREYIEIKRELKRSECKSIMPKMLAGLWLVGTQRPGTFWN